VREIIEDMAGRLAGVPGVVGVLLGGSRARGEHRPESDWISASTTAAPR
jgi:predicted nucleotidyltransferase